MFAKFKLSCLAAAFSWSLLWVTRSGCILTVASMGRMVCTNTDYNGNNSKSNKPVRPYFFFLKTRKVLLKMREKMRQPEM